MIVEFIAFLLAGGLIAIATGHLARWIASYAIDESMTSVASFSFVLGAIMFGAPRGLDASSKAAEIGMDIGSAAGLVLLWWTFFRREKLA